MTGGASACRNRAEARKSSSEPDACNGPSTITGTVLDARECRGAADAASKSTALVIACGSWRLRAGCFARRGRIDRVRESAALAPASPISRQIRDRPTDVAQAPAATSAAAGAAPAAVEGSRGPERLPRQRRDRRFPGVSLEADRADGSDGWYLGMAGIAVVLALGGGIAAAARRFAPGSGAGALQVVSRVSLSPKHSVYLLRAGGRVLLVGTGPQGAPSLISELDEIPEIEPAAGARRRGMRHDLRSQAGLQSRGATAAPSAGSADLVAMPDRCCRAIAARMRTMPASSGVGGDAQSANQADGQDRKSPAAVAAETRRNRDQRARRRSSPIGRRSWKARRPLPALRRHARTRSDGARRSRSSA